MIRLFSILALAAALCGCGSKEVWKREAFALSVPSESPASTSRTNLVALRRLTISPRFQSRSFIYRTAENSYEADPYAGFLDSPERALSESIRATLREDGKFGRVVEPDSGLVPSVTIEATVNELEGDTRNVSQPVAVMAIHFIVYEGGADGPGRVLLDKICTERTPIARRTPAALVAAWNEDLRQIMNQLISAYAEANPNDR